MYKLINFLLISVLINKSNCDGTFKNPIRFPIGGPFMGIEVAIAMPLELENYDIFVSYNFEGNYVVPENETEFQYPPVLERSLNIARKFLYDDFEFKLKTYGYEGKECVLRAICEASEYTFDHTGVLTDIVKIILTPSSSKSEGLLDYEAAETYGKLHKHCKKYKKKCSLSVLAFFSELDHIV